MDEATRLMEGLIRQRDRYLEVAALAERQRSLLEAGDLDGLMKLIETKRAKLEEVEAVKRETAGLMERWPELRAAAAPEVVRRVEQVVDETRALLEKILKTEEEDRRRFESGRDERAAEIRNLRQRKKLRDAYGQKGEGGPGVIDDKK